jgi:hypothetical protein
VSFELIVALLNKFPELVPFALTESMASLVDASYINKSFDSAISSPSASRAVMSLITTCGRVPG